MGRVILQVLYDRREWVVPMGFLAVLLWTALWEEVNQDSCVNQVRVVAFTMWFKIRRFGHHERETGGSNPKILRLEEYLISVGETILGLCDDHQLLNGYLCQIYMPAVTHSDRIACYVVGQIGDLCRVVSFTKVQSWCKSMTKFDEQIDTEVDVSYYIS